MKTKKILSFALAMLMGVPLFAGCEKQDTPPEPSVTFTDVWTEGVSKTFSAGESYTVRFDAAFGGQNYIKLEYTSACGLDATMHFTGEGGKKYSERFAKSCSGVLVFFMKLFAPLSRLLTKIGQAAARLTPGDGETSMTEDEIYDIIEDMTEEGSLDEEQGDLISSALQFGEVTVESVLTPRVDLAAVDIASSHEEILAYIKDQPHSRLPVYEGSIDNIIGILQIRRFIKAYLRQGNDLDIRPLLDEAFFIHQSMNIDELLPVMSKRKLNMAVVTDNYGGTLGIVTVEDILEELVGEIWDEEDVVEEPVVELPDGSYQVDADQSVSDVFELFGFEDPEENEELINTLMGEWAYEQFAAIPKTGESFEYHGLRVTVTEMEHNRILKLNVSLAPQAKEGGEQ